MEQRKRVQEIMLLINDVIVVRSEFRGECRVGMKRGEETDACRVVRSYRVAYVRRSIAVAVTQWSLTVRLRLVGEADRLAAGAARRHDARVRAQVSRLRLHWPRQSTNWIISLHHAGH